MTYHSAITLVFFLAFIALVIWVYRPGRKQQYQDLANIPLRDEQRAGVTGRDGEQNDE